MEYNKAEFKQRRREIRNNPTKPEKSHLSLIRKRQIKNVKFRRQFGIDVYVVDFYSPEIKLAIEVDGDTHFKDEEVKKDKRRQDQLEKDGIRFIRFTNNEVIEAPDWVIDKIRETVVSLQNSL